MRLIRENYVAVAYTGNAGNAHKILHPVTGKEIANDFNVSTSLEKGIAAWGQLSLSERRPAVRELPALDIYEEPPTPPINGLILQAYTRGLLRDEKGNLHRPRRYLMAGGGYGWPAEPQSDHVWLKEDEAKSLIPADPKEDVSLSVPKSVCQRIATFHLLDKALGTPGFFWDKSSCSMTLRVFEVSDTRIRMKLEGNALLGEKDGGYPVNFDGLVIYDREKRKLIHFMVVALGRDGGEQRTPKARDSSLNISYEVSKGTTPLLAVAFELASGERPLDRVPPYPLMYDSAKNYNRPYFGK